MNVTDVATIAAATAAWVAIYWNRRQTRVAENDMASRIAALEEINRRISEERKERETQIVDRVLAHYALQQEALATEFQARQVSNEIQVLYVLMYYQQFAMAYLILKDFLNAKDPSMAERFATFVNNQLFYIDTQKNRKRVSLNPETTAEKITAAYDKECAAMKELVSAGQDLMRNLYRVGAITNLDGDSFPDNMVPLTHETFRFDDILNKMNQPPSTVKRTPA